MFFLIWLHGVLTSDRSDPAWYTRSSGLAVGGWFIPLAQFVMGPLALRDLWAGTRQARPRAAPQPRTMPGLVVCYAIAWGLSALLTFSSRSLINQGTPPSSPSLIIEWLQEALAVELGAPFLSIVAAILLALVIRKISGFTQR